MRPTYMYVAPLQVAAAQSAATARNTNGQKPLSYHQVIFYVPYTTSDWSCEFALSLFEYIRN